MSFTIQLSGLQSTINRLKKTGDDIAKEVDAEFAAGAEKISTSAKRLCPVDTGLLRSSISASRVSFLEFEIVAQKDYAAYVEFGTKSNVTIPKGLEAYAKRVQRGDGTGQGVRAQPYFFPSVYAYQPVIVKNIIKLLREKRK
jgi:HK97 gp10 family phage protein